MGSEQRTRNGLSGAADGAKGYPEQFTIIDLDVSAVDLKARYAGTKRHAYICEIIDGAVQRQRTKRPPSLAFIRGLRRAKQIPSLSVCDLGRDGTKDGWETIDGKKRKAGVNHVIIIDGRQRGMATRENNRLDADEHGKPPRMLECNYVTFPAAGTRDAVVLFKVGANVREHRTFSSRAEDAADMRRGGYSDEDIAPYVEARDAAEVALLCDLDGCVDAVKDAVDDGSVALAAVKTIATLNHAEQARRVARRSATPAGGNGAAAKRARDDAAPPRLKARGGAFAQALGVAVLATSRSYSADEVAALLEACAGSDDGLSTSGVGDDVREMVAKAKATKRGVEA